MNLYRINGEVAEGYNHHEKEVFVGAETVEKAIEKMKAKADCAIEIQKIKLIAKNILI